MVDTPVCNQRISRHFLQGFVEKTGLQPDQLILGGDHLGPSPWQALPALKR